SAYDARLRRLGLDDPPDGATTGRRLARRPLVVGRSNRVNDVHSGPGEIGPTMGVFALRPSHPSAGRVYQPATLPERRKAPIGNALLPLRLVQLGRVLDDPVHLCADAEAVAGDELDGGGRVTRERSTETGGKAGEALAGVVLPLSACLAFARVPANETDLGDAGRRGHLVVVDQALLAGQLPARLGAAGLACAIGDQLAHRRTSVVEDAEGRDGAATDRIAEAPPRSGGGDLRPAQLEVFLAG